MRVLACLLLGAVAVTGCAQMKEIFTPAKLSASNPPGVPPEPSTNAAPVTNPTPAGKKFIISPETGVVGKVVRVNDNARFAVLNFPVGAMPGAERRLNVYRRGLKVGEVKVTGPQSDDNTVADILNGEVQVGDELRTD